MRVSRDSGSYLIKLSYSEQMDRAWVVFGPSPHVAVLLCRWIVEGSCLCLCILSILSA
jgi:hypothetical protein